MTVAAAHRRAPRWDSSRKAQRRKLLRQDASQGARPGTVPTVENAAFPRQSAPPIAFSRCPQGFSPENAVAPNATKEQFRRKPARTYCRLEGESQAAQAVTSRDGRPRRAIVRGQLNMAEDNRTIFSISLSAQELEFAAACRDFVLQKKPELRSSIVVADNMLSIADQPHVRQAFMELGLARLVRVLRLAIVGKAIAIRRAPRLLFDLARFRTKIVRALRRRAD
ncbi:hypothetical protein [Bradyrhizobium sp. USDA 3315]